MSDLSRNAHQSGRPPTTLNFAPSYSRRHDLDSRRASAISRIGFRFGGRADMAGPVAGLAPVENEPTRTSVDSADQQL
jgi:hypothetical protein